MHTDDNVPNHSASLHTRDLQVMSEQLLNVSLAGTVFWKIFTVVETL